MRVFFGIALFFFGHLIFANSDPVIWSGVGYFVDSGKTSSIYPNLTSLEKELNLSKLLADEFSKNENLIIGGSENTSSDEVNIWKIIFEEIIINRDKTIFLFINLNVIKFFLNNIIDIKKI